MKTTNNLYENGLIYFNLSLYMIVDGGGAFGLTLIRSQSSVI